MAEHDKLTKQLGYAFKDEALLERALTHRSIPGLNNERLEFLGDALLSVIIAEELFKRHPDAREGELSRMRSSLVKGETLAELARDLEVQEYLHLGPGEKRSGGQHRQSILADALEALVGAIYLDGGFTVTRDAVLEWFHHIVQDISALEPSKDAKSELQEWLQARKLPLPTYTAEVTGAAHEQTFVVTCTVEGLTHESEGVSTNRRSAEQMAAQNFLELLNE